MEARGNLMLSILARSLQNYFLLESSNVNQPANFIGNKVTGIVSRIKRLGSNPIRSNLSSAIREQVRPCHLLWRKYRVHSRVRPRPRPRPRPFILTLHLQELH
jgi:hypothetical protein